MFAVTVFEI